ncbi:MAG: phosphatase PAP2 family protein, partial [Chloroflexota bacterium]|nr:phosphatase PAP2 family protein [Chloroflexota bacterium]
AVFGLLTYSVAGHRTVVFDSTANWYLHSWSSPSLDLVMQLGSTIGSRVIILPLGAAALVLLVRGGYRREAVFLLVSVAGGIVANSALKELFQRARPSLPWAEHIPEYSFPSGHSMGACIFYVGLAAVVWSVLGRCAGVPALLLSVLIVAWVGSSRIYLGFHYFSDVLGGAIAGLLWLVVVATVVKRGGKLTRGRRRHARSMLSPS